MKLFEKLRKLLFESYGEWFLNEISNAGRGFSFIDRQLEQDLESQEARLTLTLFDASYRCDIEVEIENMLVNKLGISMPAEFQQVDLIPAGRYKDDPAEIRFSKRFNKTHVRWVADEPLKPNEPRTIIFPVEHLEGGFGRITIGLPFKLGLGGGVLNANALIGLSDPDEIDVQAKHWKNLKEQWLHNHSDPSQNKA